MQISSLLSCMRAMLQVHCQSLSNQGVQQRKRIYIILVHRKIAARTIKSSAELQALIDRKYRVLDVDYALRPDPNHVLFSDQSKEVAWDMKRRMALAEKARGKSPKSLGTKVLFLICSMVF